LATNQHESRMDMTLSVFLKRLGLFSDEKAPESQAGRAPT
jgi:hypothetical protein